MSAARTDLTRTRRGLEELGCSLADLYYRNLVGELKQLDTGPVFAEHAGLATEKALTDVTAERKRAEREGRGEDARLLRYLEYDLLGTVVGERFQKASDELSNIESSATITANGATKPYRDYPALVLNEPDRERRRAWRAAEDAVRVKELIPRRERLIHETEAYVRDDLGQPSEAKQFESVKGFSLKELETVTRDLLRTTKSLYRDAFDDRLRKAFGIPLAEAEGHDFAPIRRAPHFDGWFPRDELVKACFRTHKALGLNLDTLPNVTLDLEARPGKQTRAFLYPVRVPSDIRLVTYPMGGFDDWRSLMHESGHAVHFAYTDASLPYEDRTMGEYGVTETYAFLFENLLRDPAWLEENARVPKDKVPELLDHIGTFELRSLRYYSGALAYDHWLAKRRGLEGAKEKYVRSMTSALLYKARDIDYLETDGLYGTAYLRAWLFEAMLRASLKEKFGDRWWHDPGAGRLLKDLFKRGSAPKCEDLARDLDLGDGLDVKPLRADLERMLGAAA
ncbi:MAG TPA: hypothetical protein VM889_01475 [Candidatus Thermoplasmatota archaeon]|nr:hypothetical protein [Candidatus Thermoplasmatota archaeon]